MIHMENVLKPALTRIAAATLVVVLTGCAVGSPYQRPDVDLPQQWDNAPAAPAAAKVDSTWWKQFGSAELDGLVERALAANQDLAAAASRIAQARASAATVNANRYPTVGLSASAGKSRSEGITTDTDSARLSIGYEADLWGGLSAERAGAEARVAASEFNRDAVALMLQADVAANYFQALALKDRIAIANKNLAAAREVLRLVELRYEQGTASGLEVSQQRTAVLNLEAQIPQLEQDLRTTETALAVLLGEAPQGFHVGGSGLAGFAAPQIAAWQPPALLERRPDVRAAEAQLAASQADVNAARAALYPQLSLSLGSVASGVFSGGSSVVSTLAASLTQTLFDGGARQGQLNLTRARQEEVVAQYLQSVLDALKEVQDGMGAVQTAQTRDGLLERALQEAREAYRIANARYAAGSSDLLELLDSQRTLLAAEDARIGGRLNTLTGAVTLYRALGGGWQAR